MSKRKLTPQEIKDILSFIEPRKSIPLETSTSVTNRIKKQLQHQLQSVVTYPVLIPDIKSEIQRFYFSSQIEPGECVGILTAQSIGEKQTQSNLNVFHKAGSTEKQPVVSKFSELLNTTKEPKVPSYLVYFIYGNDTINMLRNTIGSSIINLTFSKISKNISICIDKKPEIWYNAYNCLENKNYQAYTDCVTIKVDMEKLYEFKITLKDISEVISNEYVDMVCVYSPDCFSQLDIFVNTKNIELSEEKLVFITKQNFREIYLQEVVIPILEDISLCGISGIESMFFIRDGSKWMIETHNQRKKLTESVLTFKTLLAHPIVDRNRTISNNVWDIYYTLGIEATRQYMIEQFSAIMKSINTCHIMLLVDRMTHSGTISSISRYTTRQEDLGPFGKASFEETLDNFMKAGVYGQEEPTKGVSASIICGKRAPIGTGLCDIKMDLSKLI